MIEKIGDYWAEAKEGYNALCCTTNMRVNSYGQLIMGAGIAKDFRDRYKGLSSEWGRRISEDKHHNGFMCTLWKTPYIHTVVSLPTKTDWRENSSYDLIEKSVWTLVQVANIFDWSKVLLTRPGCGNGGLKWDEVKKRISILDNRFVVIQKG